MKRINYGWFLVLLVCAAQIAAQGATGVSVNSNPKGAQVVIAGDLQLSGITPTHFDQPLIGQYEVTIKKSGYESYKKKLYLDPSQDNVIEAQLTPKTPLKAAMRSFFIPGWGQHYSEHKGKGYLFTTATILAGGAFLIIDADFQDKFDTYETISEQYANASSVERRNELRAQYVDAQKEAYDAENVRRASIAVFAGVWALNVLDAMFFFPHQHDEPAQSKGLTIAPSTDFKTVGVKFNVAF